VTNANQFKLNFTLNFFILNNYLILYKMSKIVNNKIELQDELEELQKKYNTLLKETSENTIISSMKDMKELYEKKEKEFKRIEQLADYQEESLKAIKVMLTNILKDLKIKRTITYIHSYPKLNFIKDIIEDTLYNKTTILYGYNFNEDE